MSFGINSSFINTFQFLSSLLDSLFKNLGKADLIKSQEFDM